MDQRNKEDKSYFLTSIEKKEKFGISKENIAWICDKMWMRWKEIWNERKCWENRLHINFLNKYLTENMITKYLNPLNCEIYFKAFNQYFPKNHWTDFIMVFFDEKILPFYVLLKMELWFGVWIIF